MLIRVSALFIFTSFYLIYLGKAWLLKKQGLKVNLLGDKQSSCEKYFEIVLRAMTGFGELIQFLAPFLFAVNQTGWGYAGLVLTFLGVLLFFISVKTMGINWRAGVNEQQRTELVTTGIYRFSRNPAFVAFDLLYLGFALIFPNLLMIVMAVLALFLFDLQIRGEENYLITVFGERYRDYQKAVRRYL
ncbi:MULTISPECIES: methyltransferase family protein [Enterococcus]|uniref:methyltransferase family protein n=1 Tax=Enterococcus TaxID=1350 RepID=UPI0022DFD2BC|nr:isoprenylcysteine carboxylmethyltransferase family protein [Enterococcus avium]MDB1728198.1 isoprenylcysteine carboxylmethyltransferase family protein [Enterococcus avium]MDB1732450.1 isoprenylcysteine carboxylmethyltransferase family protein [Enterococcus avium]